jgi:hypothetical protein
MRREDSAIGFRFRGSPEPHQNIVTVVIYAFLPAFPCFFLRCDRLNYNKDVSLLTYYKKIFIYLYV